MVHVPYDSCHYADFWTGREYEDQSERIALKKFFNQIPERESILDIGGGYGRLATLYSPLFKKCQIVDPSEILLKQGLSNLSHLSNIEFKIGKSDNLPVGHFDVVLMVRVVHHLPDLQPTFRQVYTSLQPHGYYILEFANKIHFLAIFKALILGNLSYLSNLEPVDVRSEKAKKERKILFFNHHPKKVENLLEKSGFKVIDKLSVSNFRHPFLKKIVPLNILLFFENLLQKPLSKIYFGPSIFLLCQRQ